jgi:predicted Rossmann fold flavoprotein
MEYHFNAIVNWIPAYNEQSLKDQLQQHRAHSGAQLLVNKNPLGLPARFWEFILSESNIPSNLRWTDLSSAAFKLLVNKLSAFEVAVKGKTTFKEEFVTAGGILLSEIDPNTMMSRKMENLFFAGEVMDVDGITGGYNFQHAWTSGFIAAKSIAHLSS